MSAELTRAQRIAGQHDALDMFMFMRRNDPSFVAEERRNRATHAQKPNPVMAEIDAKLGKGGLDHGR